MVVSPLRILRLGILLAGILLVSTNCLVYAGMFGKNDNLEVGKTVELSGKISVKGTDPHTYLCLTTADRIDYRITGPLKDEIRNQYQYRFISIKGTVKSIAVGPGFPAEIVVSEITAVLAE